MIAIRTPLPKTPCIEIVDFLIKNGADLNVCNETNSSAMYRASGTALHAAVGRCQLDVVSLLLANGANTEITNMHGETPLFNALQEEYSPKFIQIAKMLIETYRANVNAKNNKGRTPFFVACYNLSSHPKIVSLLIKNGADFNVTDYEEVTLYQCAVNKGYQAEIEALFKKYGKSWE